MRAIFQRHPLAALLLGWGLLLASCAPPGADQAADQPPTEPGAPPPAETPAGETAGGDAEPAPGGALKVGMIAPLSGPLAGPGEDMVEGFKLWLDQNDGQLGGRTVDFTVEDTQGNPEIGVQVTTRLVQREQVDLVVGPLLGNVGLAVGDYIATVDTPLFYAIPSSDTFLRNRPETMFVAGGTAAQDAHPMGAYAWEQGYKRVLTICQDYAFGHELCGGFVNVFTDHGGEIVEQLWAPLGTADYGPLVSQIQTADYDAVYTGLVGADSVKFVQAWNDFGLTDSPLIASLQPLDQSLVRAMGAGAMGMVSSGHYAEGRDSPATQEFVSAYEEAYGKIPSYYSASGHLAGQWIDAALDALGGEMPDTDTFLDTVESLEFEDTAFGPVRVDDRGNVIWDVYIREVVERDDGAVWNVVRASVEAVPPTYYYDYEAYVGQPVYDRSYQGVDWPADCSVIVTDDCPLEGS